MPDADASTTALEAAIRAEIARHGPMPLDRYMALCLGDPEHGYYMTRDPFGRGGDFTTAPEISQVFGELIGVWCAQCWSDLGKPDRLAIVELGPGRGTLMADLLRTARAVPHFDRAIAVHLVEMSPALKARQRDTLADDLARVAWHDAIADLPAGPMLMIANEFFDAIPVRQLERCDSAWFERVVHADGEHGLSIGLAAEPVAAPPTSLSAAPDDGAVLELAPERSRIAEMLGAKIARHGGAGVIVDYGHAASVYGDTLQAVRGHRFARLTEAPGQCDLTAHVDFEALASGFRAGGAVVSQTIEQRDFLAALGIDARRAALARSAAPAQADEVVAGVARLTDCEGMGTLFKVCAISAPDAPVPYPFMAGTR